MVTRNLLRTCQGKLWLTQFDSRPASASRFGIWPKHIRAQRFHLTGVKRIKETQKRQLSYMRESRDDFEFLIGSREQAASRVLNWVKAFGHVFTEPPRHQTSNSAASSAAILFPLMTILMRLFQGSFDFPLP